MKQADQQSRFFAMRQATDPASTTTAVWDGEERRASYRQAAKLFKNNPSAAFDTKAIFRETIVHEIKNGKLSPGRRRRIIRYAARMGLSAVEAGQLLSECREQATTELEACKKTPTLRLRIPETDDYSTTTRVLIAVATAILVNAAAILLFA